MVVFISILLVSQACIIFCCAALGKYHSEMDDPELQAYEDEAQDEYVRQWNKKHKNHD